jgi:hypothetical protein
MTRASSHQPEHDDDRMYLDLKGALERLCRAQTFVPVALAVGRADSHRHCEAGRLVRVP